MSRGVKDRPEGTEHAGLPDLNVVRSMLEHGHTAELQARIEGGHDLTLTCTTCGGGERYDVAKLGDDERPVNRDGMHIILAWVRAHHNCARRAQQPKPKRFVQQRIRFGDDDGLL